MRNPYWGERIFVRPRSRVEQRSRDQVMFLPRRELNETNLEAIESFNYAYAAVRGDRMSRGLPVVSFSSSESD